MNHWLRLFVAAAVIASVPAFTSPQKPQSADAAVREAKLRKAIADQPKDFDSRVELSMLLEEAGRAEEAERVLRDAKLASNDSRLFRALAALYNRRGDFDQTIAALQGWTTAEPSNAEAHYTLATYYWDRAYRNRDTLTPDKQLSLITHGRFSIDRALAINPEYVDAIVYKNLLIRLEALQEKDPQRQREMIKEAEALQARAKALIAQRTGGPAGSGVTPGSIAPPPPPPPPPTMAPVRVGGNIAIPTKIVDAPPVYPAIAQSARVQGVVIIEATIGPDGHVTDAKILRSIPLLDQAAIDAVMQWQYTQTLLNGVPVPVIMTVTVNFTLQ